MTPVNMERGEVEITLAGKTYVMRPTFGAMVEIEQTSGEPIYALCRRLLEGNVSVTEVTHVITAGLRS